MIKQRLSVKPFAVIGHRGAAGVYIENTLKSINYAISLGVDIVEIDIRQTRNGELVVYHDEDLTRLAGINKKIRDLTYDWITNNVRLNGETIPRLVDVLETVKGRTGLFIEIKEPETTKKIITTLRDTYYEFLDDTALISFHDEAVINAKKLYSKLTTGLIYYKPPGRIIDAKNLKCEIVLPHYRLATSKAVSFAHRLGLKVVAWTVNEIDTAIKLYKSGIDGIATDYPNKIIDLRKEIAGSKGVSEYEIY
ncbi:MAG: glycerophosphodiester phosphodiesterase [Staphylothermus sp.]|nr:glycerophosphodiester phosphodiesterase [Staphylothermus sp.]